MPGSFLDRLRANLAPDYEVQRELGAGGMGTVFLARDVALDRYVAIKVLRPELATAQAAKRFLREARLLASFSHPNMVPVYRAGEADGLFYYVMDYVQGETLKDRLARGALSQDEVVKLGTDLLSALDAAHERGVIHRDIKPSNIFLLDDRALLGDFGVAKSTGEQSPPLTGPGQAVGTPAYMPPEQMSGEATSKSDIYALGMVLYEAVTGERWTILMPVEEVDWTRLPGHLGPVVRRALAWSPDERWESATAFRGALSAKPGGLERRVPDLAKTAVGAAIVLAAVLIGREVFRQPDDAAPVRPAETSTVSDLAILPAEVLGDWEAGIGGADLAHFVATKLERVPELRVVPTRRSIPWWEAASATTPPGQAAAELDAKFVARATVIPSGAGVDVELDVFDSEGEPVPGIRRIEFAESDLAEVGDSIALRLMDVVLGGELPEVTRLTRDVDALIQFLLGERAFARGAGLPAVDYYRTAVELDPGFALAWWRMANAWRWVGERGPYAEDFRQLYEEHSSRLGPLDSMLLAAQLTPPGPERLRIYREARARFPSNDFAAYLYGEELFNRGPLWGQPLDSAVSALEIAAALNPYWALTYVHLVWANIRLGRREEARRALDEMPRIDAKPEEGWLYPPEVFEQAYLERFEPPEVARQGLEAILSDPVFLDPAMLVPMSRLVASFDLPETQLVLGGALVEVAAAVPHLRASGHESMGLALIALGRVESALSHFDSAAVLFGGSEAMLQAAQWRVLPRALGLPVSDSSVAHGLAILERLAGDETVRDRAAWTLAIGALSAGDLVRARRWMESLEAGAEEERTQQLLGVLRAVELAETGQTQEALQLSDSLLVYQAATLLLTGARHSNSTLGDPFARAALHLKRGGWLERVGDPAGAAREWLWSEAEDTDGFPGPEPAKAGEIDWALGNYGRFLRGIAELQMGEVESACRHLGRVLELWDRAEPDMADLVRRAGEAARACN